MTPAQATVDEVRAHDLQLRRDRDVWSRLLLSSRLLPAHSRLLGLVVALHSDEAGQAPAWCSLADLVNQTGLTINQVRYALDLLQRDHWLVRGGGTFGDGRANAWDRPLYLTWPPEPGQ